VPVKFVDRANAPIGVDVATVTAELQDELQVAIDTGTHTLLADEPERAGGDDAGPDPYELLLAALGACTAMTVRLYCERKGWALRGVTAELHHERVHARDCEDCDDDRRGYIDRITSDIRIDGDFTDEQRARLMEVAVRCPVHKTLEKSVTLRDEVTVT
jgi:putative redox protein